MAGHQDFEMTTEGWSAFKGRRGLANDVQFLPLSLGDGAVNPIVEAYEVISMSHRLVSGFWMALLKSINVCSR